jgi:hypothetical protein
LLVVRILTKLLASGLALSLPLSSLAGGFHVAAAQSAIESCPARSLLLTFDVYRWGELREQAPIWQMPDGRAFFFRSGMSIDADGAPNAYNADDTGLDYLHNAGQPGQWDGIVEDEDGIPVVQGPDDPYPGYYISCTSLFDRTKHHRDPARFVDATQIPYVALPGDLAERTGTRLGDLVLVYNERTDTSSFAIFADIGAFGEGSIALAENLGIHSDAKRGGSPGGIFYLVFPGSGDGQPKSADEINRTGAGLLESLGGVDRILACAGSAEQQVAAAPAESNRPVDIPAAERTVTPTAFPTNAPAN